MSIAKSNKLALLDQDDTDRIAFNVYRKALVYVGGTITFIATVLAIWGYSDWQDLRQNIKTLQVKASRVDSLLNLSTLNIEKFEKQRSNFTQDWENNLKNLGRLEGRLEETEKNLRQKVDERLRTLKSDIQEISDDMTRKQALTSKEMEEFILKADLQIKNIALLRTEILAHLDSLNSTGYTTLILQANTKEKLSIFGFSIAIGNVKEKSVEGLKIEIINNSNTYGKRNVGMGEVFEFRCPSCPIGNELYEIIFKIRPIVRLNQPLLHDLLVAELRWHSTPRQKK